MFIFAVSMLAAFALGAYVTHRMDNGLSPLPIGKKESDEEKLEMPPQSKL